MKDVNWGEVKALFSAALQVPVADREALLTLEAGGNPALIAEVRSLLDAHDKPGAFLDTVTHEFRSQAFAASSGASARLGERIGAYRIVGVLGGGGMGDVFKAVRDDDQYHAEVAIKLMRADVRSSLTEQRFRTERQILAGLDHRNIARLLDGGTAEGGMPYVVMELVVGEPIDGWCESRELTIRDRVQLFLQVCAAVSYAHQHLVVHRDLKPNNILVTTDGSVKLLDFGIAKLLEADADTALAEANATATTLRAMTLEYASPEQVSGGLVTTVSDVYSLGVVLYRLLTGKSPYGVRTTDAQRMQEILSDTTPTRPSQVQRSVDGDLDNILLMALRKEPQRRYGSVEQLANDLRNYLSGMPVHARGNSLGYRAGKFVRRRKIEIAAGVLVACSLIGAAVFSMREARIAEQERQIAQRHFGSVRKLANTLLFDLHDEIAKVPGSIKTQEMLVETSLDYLDTLYRSAASDPGLQEELATAYKKVGDIQGNERGSNTGHHQDALKSFARSIALFEPLIASDPSNHRAGFTLANAYVEQGSILLVLGRVDDALTSVNKGVALGESLAPFFAKDADRAGQLGTAYWTQADILVRLGRSPEAMASIDKLLALVEEFWRSDPKSKAALSILSGAYNNASAHPDMRLPADARNQRTLFMLRRSVWASEQLVALAPDDEEERFSLALSQSNLGRQLAWQGDHSAALPLFRAASTVVGARARNPDDARARYLSAMVDSALAEALFKLGHVEEARVTLLRCNKELKALIASSSTLRIEYAFGHNAVRLGELYALLAGDSRRSRNDRLTYWQQARDAYESGVSPLQKVAAAVALEEADMAPVNVGVAGLARARSEIATLTK